MPPSEQLYLASKIDPQIFLWRRGKRENWTLRFRCAFKAFCESHLPLSRDRGWLTSVDKIGGKTPLFLTRLCSMFSNWIFDWTLERDRNSFFFELRKDIKFYSSVFLLFEGLIELQQTLASTLAFKSALQLNFYKQNNTKFFSWFSDFVWDYSIHAVVVI